MKFITALSMVASLLLSHHTHTTYAFTPSSISHTISTPIHHNSNHAGDDIISHRGNRQYRQIILSTSALCASKSSMPPVSSGARGQSIDSSSSSSLKSSISSNDEESKSKLRKLTLYNSLTRTKDPFTPQSSSNHVSMYTCGPTV